MRMRICSSYNGELRTSRTESVIARSRRRTSKLPTNIHNILRTRAIVCTFFAFLLSWPRGHFTFRRHKGRGLELSAQTHSAQSALGNITLLFWEGLNETLISNAWIWLRKPLVVLLEGMEMYIVE